MKRYLTMAALATLAGLTACEPSSTDTLVARANQYEFTVSQAVDILGPRAELPNRPEVVNSLADLWLDYTLLADAATEDSTFASVDVSELVQQQVEGQMVNELRAQAVSADTTLTEAELRRLYDEQRPGMRVQARHILMGYPGQPTEAQKDSVREAMAGILERIRAGEDFAELARTYSQDPGSGAQGGDLGEFGAGEMVRPFEEAAFALEPGEVSDLVETPFGIHIIRLDRKTVPAFDEILPMYRVQVIAERYQEAESLYIAELEEAASPQVQEGAGALVKQLASERTNQLAPRAARRELVRYEGGEVTVDEFLTFLGTRPLQARQQIMEAPEDVLEEQLLRVLAQRELFLQEARETGLAPSEATRDSIADTFRDGMAEAAGALGLDTITVAEDETRVQVVESAVLDLLDRIVRDQQEVIPLGPLGYALRRTNRTELFQAGMLETVDRITEIRGPGSANPTMPPAAPGGTPDPAGAPGGNPGQDGAEGA